MKLPTKIFKKAVSKSSLAQLLKNSRHKSKLTLREVEDRTGISNAQVSLLESGKTINPSAFSLVKLVSLYKLDWSDVIQRLEQDHEIKN